jgi:VanZ family protein
MDKLMVEKGGSWLASTRTVWVFRILSWFGIAAIIVLSVVPAADRPVTGAGQDLEHIVALGLTATAFTFGHRQKIIWLLLAAVFFCAGIELIQTFAPTRHARLSDFMIDSLASIAAIGIATAIKFAVYRDR